MKFLIFLFVTNLYALSFLPEKRPSPAGAIHKAHKAKGNRKGLEKLKKENRNLKKLLSIKLDTPGTWESKTLFQRGDYIKGRLLASALSTNIKTPIIIHTDHGKVQCIGATSGIRIVGKCNYLIGKSGSVSINASLLETDGSFGLRSDIIDSSEEYLAGILASEMTKGILSVQSAKHFDESSKKIGKSAILEGLINTSNEATNIFKEEFSKKEKALFVRAPKRVLLLINEEVNL